MNIIFDLDGTLIDSRERLYRLFQFLVPASKLSFEQYWELKRNHVGHEEILRKYFSYSDGQVSQFLEYWLEKIELRGWLNLDKPFDGVTSFLMRLKSSNRLYLATSRQFAIGVTRQIAAFGWSDVFEEVFVTCRKDDKYNLIRHGNFIERTDWIVGDTGNDINVGKKLGINTAAVLSGFLCKEKLLLYKPDVIVGSVLDLKFD